MRKIRSTTDLTEAEIRMLLQEKLRKSRQKRLQWFQHTGRAITLVRENESSFSSFYSQVDYIEPADKPHLQTSIGTWFSNSLFFACKSWYFLFVVIAQ